MKRTARLHANERGQLQEYCEQQQRAYMRDCDAIRQRTTMCSQRIRAINLGDLPANPRSSSLLVQLGKIQQALYRA